MLKKRISVLFVVMTTLVSISYAQQKSVSSPWQFHSINNIGLLEGQTGSSFQLQTINGAQYRSWFGGAGLGLDFYRIRSIPLFLDLRKEFGKSSNKLFAYADAGVNFSWVTDNEKTAYVTGDKFSKGFYCDIGLGYKTAVGKNNALLISLGYSYKKLTETYNAEFFVPLGLSDNDPDEHINYSLNRLSIKIGWEF